MLVADSDYLQCIEEVKCYVHSFIPSRIIHALDGGVIKSDDSVEISLKDDISNGAARLRNIAVKTEDSENSVLDIVDPYLYPFAFQKTRTLHFDTLTTSECVSRSGEGEPVKKPSSDECVQQEHNKYPNDVAWSNRFQWLPFDVVFENRGAGASRYALQETAITNTELIVLAPASLATSTTSTQ